LGAGPEPTSPSSEILKASVIDAGSCRVECIPWFITGINFGDTIAVENRDGQLYFDRVVRTSGHATFHLKLDREAIYPDGETGEVDGCYQFLVDSWARYECKCEAFSEAQTSLDIPPHESIDLRLMTLELLDVGKDVGLWTWTEGTFNLAAGREAFRRDLAAAGPEALANLDDVREKLKRTPVPGWQSWWLSFCDPAKPDGQSFIGACVVQIPDVPYPGGHDDALQNALRIAYLMDCNPGGDVRGARIHENSPIFGQLIYHRLMGEAEIYERGLAD
jgi:hypothetical protein